MIKYINPKITVSNYKIRSLFINSSYSEKNEEFRIYSENFELSGKETKDIQQRLLAIIHAVFIVSLSYYSSFIVEVGVTLIFLN